jgi:hypothetical protein
MGGGGGALVDHCLYIKELLITVKIRDFFICIAPPLEKLRSGKWTTPYNGLH